MQALSFFTVLLVAANVALVSPAALTALAAAAGVPAAIAPPPALLRVLSLLPAAAAVALMPGTLVRVSPRPGPARPGRCARVRCSTRGRGRWAASGRAAGGPHRDPTMPWSDGTVDNPSGHSMV